jgi:hypothetical protein
VLHNRGMVTFKILKRDGVILDVTVDDEDWDEVSRHHWHMAGGKGHTGRYVMGSDGFYLHRLIAYRAGIIPSLAVEQGQRGKWSQSVDHANGNKLDNRRANLRLRDRAAQMRNPNDKPRSTNRSGHRGVSFVKSRERFGKPWMAYVTVNYKTINLGWYATVEEAAAARQAWDQSKE